jgi:hypothetical protein
VDPTAYLHVLDGIAAYCDEHGVAVRDLAGTLEPWE